MPRPTRTALPIVVLPGVVAVGALPWLWEIDHRGQAALVLGQLLVCSAGVVSAFVGGLRPVRMVFFGFLFSWLGVGPLYQISHGRLAWDDSALLDRTDLVTGALALTLVSTLLVLVTALVFDSRRRARPARQPAARVEPRPLVPWAYVGALLVISPYVILSNGGIGTFFTSRDARAQALGDAGVSVATGGAALALVSLLPAALAVAVAHLFVLRNRLRVQQAGWTRTKLLDLTGLLIGLGALAVFANPISQTRFISLAAFGSVALAVLAPRSRRAGQVFAALLGTVVLAVYPLSAVIGSTAEQRSVDVLTVFAGPDFDGFQQIMSTFIFVTDLGHSDGLYSLSALLFFVPRSIWADKATPSSIDVAAHRDYWFTNLSMPVHAEVYLDFGVPGMVLAMVGLAVLGARIDTSWLAAPASLGAFLAPYVALTQLGVLRGPLGSLAPVWIPVIVLLVLGVRRVVPTAPPEPGRAGRHEDAAQEPAPETVPMPVAT